MCCCLSLHLPALRWRDGLPQRGDDRTLASPSILLTMGGRVTAPHRSCLPLPALPGRVRLIRQRVHNRQLLRRPGRLAGSALPPSSASARRASVRPDGVER